MGCQTLAIFTLLKRLINCHLLATTQQLLYMSVIIAHLITSIDESLVSGIAFVLIWSDISLLLGN